MVMAFLTANASASHSSIKNIFFKNEGQQPTWSFKDRGTVACIQPAISLGYKRRGGVESPTPFASHATNPIPGIAEALSAVATVT